MSVEMRALGLSVISILLTSAVIGNAYYQKKQFYPSVVYITKSNPSMAVIYVQSLVGVLMMGKLMKKIFFGTLRAAEFEHLMERFWYALTETCLAFTVFRDDFNPKFVALFTVLLFLKSFHWLAEERVDYMERSPVIGVLFHLRVSSLLTVLGLMDYYMISHAYELTMAKGATVQLVFGFEYAILITMIANIAIKYVLHAAEMRADTPWENKAVFLLYTELVIGFIRVVLYVLFVAIMVRIYTLPLFAFRPMYYTMRNFKKALNDVILSRRAIRNMNTLYPDATPEELALSDNICIICREDMVNTSKKLPCGHIFHTACLRSWFQRQQTCPTCRLNILRNTNSPTEQAAQNDGMDQLNNNNQANAANANTAAANANAQNNNNNANNIFNAHPNPFANILNAQSNVNNPFSANPFSTNPLQFNPFASVPMNPIPPPPIPAFAFTPPPTIPTNLEQLSDEELRLLEGNERRNVEERIKLLKNIQLLMDASVALMNQYAIISAQFPPLQTNPTPSASSATTTPTEADTGTATTSDSVETTKSNSEEKKPITPSNTTDDEAGPSTSQKSSSIETLEVDGNVVTIEDIGENDSSDPNDPISEVRRRRLQRFESSTQES
ncbi:E3 ubiquitin-protein ligase HRD1 [Sitodiplosis mosellana]|uniref:E3 ubiquitin-protein ligase HRD1 n=1 Tax=Sitodiplosis mosellana TaxID=263140 RepID=UPI002444B6B4|nr:E3 ubiquitin-protein ligase HRD1 [Sitodiplosis mosellana]